MGIKIYTPVNALKLHIFCSFAYMRSCGPKIHASNLYQKGCDKREKG